MSFLFTAALALLALIAAPILAHLLKRGKAKEQEFPPAVLVPTAQRSARERSRLEDRLLLTLRASLIAVLAMLGAVPFVSCERLALSRSEGASIALALVVDDSMSMGARLGTADQTRFDAALGAASDLLASTRDGDAVAIVLAGKPARLLLSPTTDLAQVKRALAQLPPSDRATDLAAAVSMAEGLLSQLPQVDKRVVVLSDLATSDFGPQVEFWAPLPELQAPIENCGIVSARRRNRTVQVRVNCTGVGPAQNRKLYANVSGSLKPNPKEPRLAEVALVMQAGGQDLLLEVGKDGGVIDVFLDGRDGNARDDYAPVSGEHSRVAIAVVADPAFAATKDGGATVIEQALGALDLEVVLQPLPVVPDDAKSLEPYQALVVDDPPGFGPETRSALQEWLSRDRMAVVFLGQRVESAPLGANFEPFARGALSWQKEAAPGIDPKTVQLLGEAGASLAHVAARGRVRLDGAVPQKAEITGRWLDGAAWKFEQTLPRGGTLWTIGLPVSVAVSDFALQPAFVSLMQQLAHRAMSRSDVTANPAGVPWRVSAAGVTVDGPYGALTVEPQEGPGGVENVFAIPARVGRYQMKTEGQTRERIALVDEDEIVRQPRTLKTAERAGTSAGAAPLVQVSDKFAWLLLAILGLELALRLRGNLSRPRRSPVG